MDKEKKWNQAYADADFSATIAADVLTKNTHLLSAKGDALDLACGRAGNAQLLAKAGYGVDAVDFSPIVIDGLKLYVGEHGLAIFPVQSDIEKDGLPDKKYDVICVSFYLHRELFPQIIAALKPGGLLFYQTWSNAKVNDDGPSNPAFRLERGELLELCADLSVLIYSENGNVGDITRGIRNQATIVAQKAD